MLLRTKMWEGLTADHFKNMLIALGKKSLLNSSDSQSKNACAALTLPPPATAPDFGHFPSMSTLSLKDRRFFLLFICATQAGN